MWELKAVGQFVDCVLSVWICECGQLVITGEMGASQMSPKPRDTDKNKPCLVSCVVSAQWRSRNVPVLTDSVQSQLSSPCNLTWIVWLWDVLKINNKMWQELDTFTNTEEKLFWLKPQNHIYYLLALQHCTRWEHISFCCVNHACFENSWEKVFLNTQQKNVKTLNCSRWGIVRTPAPGFWSVSESAHGLVWLWITESHWHQDFNQ